MFRKSRLFFLKTFYPKFLFKKISLVCREKESYDPSIIGIWWRPSIGVGVMGKPKHEFKYLMVGLKFIHITMWIEFGWIGKSKIQQSLLMKDHDIIISDLNKKD